VLAQISVIAGLILSSPSLVWAQVGGEISRVKGGEPAQTCQWPTTVGLKGVCTGTLIHPQVMIYAAHCNFNSGSTSPDAMPTRGDFGESIRAGEIEMSVDFEFCKVHPDYYHPNGVNNHGHDIAFCVLKEPMKDMPIAPIIQGCERDALQPGESSVFIAGFGYHDDPGSASVDDLKYWVETPFRDFVQNDTELEIGDANTGTCAGDSGGSVFVQLDDGTWRHVGIVSYGDGNTACSNPYSYVTYSEIALPFVEDELKKAGKTDIDLTPCFDGDTWAPNENCGNYALELSKPHGAWDNRCSQDAPKSGFSATCGDAFDPGDDTGEGSSEESSNEESSGESDETPSGDDSGSDSESVTEDDSSDETSAETQTEEETVSGDESEGSSATGDDDDDDAISDTEDEVSDNDDDDDVDVSGDEAGCSCAASEQPRSLSAALMGLAWLARRNRRKVQRWSGRHMHAVRH
jgi:MYXO-CTERM domain-containing protein